MRLHRLVLTLVLLSVPALVHAQSSPCDTILTTGQTFTGTVNQAATLSVCEKPTASDGTPITQVQGWTAYLDGVATSLPLTSGATSTVTGLTLWSGAYILPPTPGQHSLQVTVTGQTAGGTMKESAKSLPLSLTVNPSAAPPATPVNLTLK